jgi:hypothetical protein
MGKRVLAAVARWVVERWFLVTGGGTIGAHRSYVIQSLRCSVFGGALARGGGRMTLKRQHKDCDLGM